MPLASCATLSCVSLCACTCYLCTARTSGTSGHAACGSDDADRAGTAKASAYGCIGVPLPRLQNAKSTDGREEGETENPCSNNEAQVGSSVIVLRRRAKSDLDRFDECDEQEKPEKPKKARKKVVKK
ncbi:unnamed protein product [Symbiodinium natans]|uniref:Secreted protein n=1 Tax=Symbiodinium natans TaxID=878477 RepID=A0A812RQ39_9DINO|nr:unnamed protein product [Symbiodinium natans]